MRLRILIVDDHASFRASVRSLLVAEGFDVVGEAETGADGLRRIAELKPDAVLLDVQLTDMDAFAVLEQLASNGPAPAVVLTSSRDAAEYGTLVADSGARGFVPKAELSGAAIRALVG